MIANLIKQLAQSSDSNHKTGFGVLCKVIAVDDAATTIDAEPVNGDASLFEVRLQADFGQNGVVCFPKAGSLVIVSVLEDGAPFVLMFSEIEKIVVKKDDFDLKEQLNKLLALNESLIDMIAKLKIQTNTGIGSVIPNQVAGLNQLKFNLGDIKDKFNLIL
jgi:hypothetical protein